MMVAPPYIAASEGRTASVRYLLELGVDVNPTDRWGNTPLDDAIREKHSSIDSVLREHGGLSKVEIKRKKLV